MDQENTSEEERCPAETAKGRSRRLKQFLPIYRLLNFHSLKVTVPDVLYMILGSAGEVGEEANNIKTASTSPPTYPWIHHRADLISRALSLVRS